MSGAMEAATERQRQEQDLGRKGCLSGWDSWQQKETEGTVGQGTQEREIGEGPGNQAPTACFYLFTQRTESPCFHIGGPAGIGQGSGHLSHISRNHALKI